MSRSGSRVVTSLLCAMVETNTMKARTTVCWASCLAVLAVVAGGLVFWLNRDVERGPVVRQGTGRPASDPQALRRAKAPVETDPTRPARPVRRTGEDRGSVQKTVPRRAPHGESDARVPSRASSRPAPDPVLRDPSKEGVEGYRRLLGAKPGFTRRLLLSGLRRLVTTARLKRNVAAWLNAYKFEADARMVGLLSTSLYRRLSSDKLLRMHKGLKHFDKKFADEMDALEEARKAYVSAKSGWQAAGRQRNTVEHRQYYSAWRRYCQCWRELTDAQLQEITRGGLFLACAELIQPEIDSAVSACPGMRRELTKMLTQIERRSGVRTGLRTRLSNPRCSRDPVHGETG